MGSSRPAKINRASSNSQAATSARSMFASRPFEEETDTTEADPLHTGAFIADAKPAVQAQPEHSPLRSFNFASIPLYAPAPVQREVSEEQELEENEIQTKLAIGKPGDQYEQEADRMAAQIMRMPEPDADEEGEAGEAIEEQEDDTIQQQPLANEITPLVQRQNIQRQETDQNAQASTNFEQQLAGQQGGGQPLPDGLKSSMASNFQTSFDRVRVHTDSAAVQMNKEFGAQAFTHGNDIYFNSGKYSPGSSGGQELMAHELTHTIQQTGGGQSDPSVQRLYSKCEAEQEEEIIQAKALPEQASDEVAVKPQPSQTESTLQDQTANASSPVELNQTEPTVGKDLSSQSPEINTSKISVAEEKAAQDPNLATAENQQTIEIAQQQDKPVTVVENGSTASTEASTNSATQAVQAVEPQQVQLPKEISAQAEGENSGSREQTDRNNSESTAQIESEVLKAVPEIKSEGTNSLSQASGLESSTEATNGEVVSQSEQAATANEGKAQLEATTAQAEQMASAGISFAPMEVALEQAEAGQTIAMQPEGSATSSTLLPQNARAGDIASGFLAIASEKVQTMTQLGAAVPGRIQAAAETAKANISTALEQQKVMVSAHLAQLRAQAQNEAQATIAQIQGQSQAAIAALPAATTQAHDKVEAEYATSVGVVDACENSQLTRIEGIYTHAIEEFRNAGTKVGDEATGIANRKAEEYRSRDNGAARAASFVGLGAVSDVAFGTDTLRNKARAQAAEAVGQEYKKGIVEEANKQADKALEGKPKDTETVHQTATKSREALQTQRQAALDSLTAAEQNAINQAQETQNQLITAAKQSLEATLSSLDQQETSQIQLLVNQGQQQIATIDSSAQQAVSSLQNALGQSASSLQNSLQVFQTQAQTVQAPDPDQLSAALAQAQGQVDSQIASIQGQVEQGVVASEQGLIQCGQQALERLNAIGQSTIDGTDSISEGLTTTMAQLVQSATDTFTKLQENHTKTTTDTATAAVDGCKKVTEGIEKTFEDMGKGLEDQFQKNVQAIEGGLRGALDKLSQDIETEAEKAAAKVDPTKELLKLVVVIAVVIVVALVVGPFAAGLFAPLGTIAGTILSGVVVGALAAGGTQLLNNLIDGKKWHEGVLQAMAIGAVTGAIGAGIGLGLNAAANQLGAQAIESTLGKFAAEFGKNFASDIIINVSTGQFSWDNIGQSLLIALLATGVSNSKFGKRVQEGSYDAGASTGSKVKAVTQSSTPDETNPPPSSTPDEATPQPSALDETPLQSTPPEETTSSQPQAQDESAHHPLSEETTSGSHAPVEESTSQTSTNAVQDSQQSASRAYRVQGGTEPPNISHERVHADESGAIKIKPEPGKSKQTKLYITFDDPQRARVYLKENRPGGRIVSFEVDPAFVQEVRANAVKQAEIRGNRGAPEISDPSKTTPEVRQKLELQEHESTAYGLPERWITRLEEAARPGSLKVEGDK